MTRVLLVRLSAMGDLCQSLGPAQALLEKRPDLELHFVTQTTFAPLLDHLGFASVVTLERGGGWAAWRALRAAMRALQPDLAVDLQGNWKSALATRWSGARRRIGAAGRHRQEPASGLLLERIAFPGTSHPTHVARWLLRQLDAAVPVCPAALVATAEEVARAAELVDSVGIAADSAFQLLVTSRPADIRSWPLSAMRQQAAASPEPVLWLRGPAERDAPTPDGAAVLTQAAGSLRDLVALGALVARNGGRVFGPDTGATHVLAAAGAATVLMSGPQDPKCTAPLAARVLRRTDAPPCVPCRARRCSYPDGPVCMQFSEYGGQQVPGCPE